MREATGRGCLGGRLSLDRAKESERSGEVEEWTKAAEKSTEGLASQ